MASSDTPEAVGRGGLLARHPVTAFFVMAYAFTWIVWSPWVLGEDGAGVLPIRLDPTVPGLLNATAIFVGPTGAALIMAAVTGGRAGVTSLLGRVVRWRVGVRWYLLAVIGIPLVMLFGASVATGSLPQLSALGGPSYLLSYVLTFVLVAVVGGPLFEEIGWRGFALPRMQPVLGPLLASLLLGVLWAFWHLPEFLVPSFAASSGGPGPLGFSLFLITVLPLNVVTTWVFNNTRASVLLAVLVHTSGDAFTYTLGMVFPPGTMDSVVPVLIGFGALAIVAVVVTRGRLSYRRLDAHAAHAERLDETARPGDYRGRIDEHEEKIE